MHIIVIYRYITAFLITLLAIVISHKVSTNNINAPGIDTVTNRGKNIYNFGYKMSFCLFLKLKNYVRPI